jgi:hypothetical protein
MSVGFMPANVSVSDLAIVTAWFANEVDDVNQRPSQNCPILVTSSASFNSVQDSGVISLAATHPARMRRGVEHRRRASLVVAPIAPNYRSNTPASNSFSNTASILPKARRFRQE